MENRRRWIKKAIGPVRGVRKEVIDAMEESVIRRRQGGERERQTERRT